MFLHDYYSMANKNVSFSVKAKDEASGALKKVSGEVNKLSKDVKNSDFSKYTQSMNNLIKSCGAYTAAIGAAIGALKGMMSAMKEWTDACNNQIKAEIQLSTAAKNNPFLSQTSVDSLKAFASEIQSVTMYGDEELLPLMAELASYGRTQDEITKIIKTSTDIASSGVMSLESAVSSLNATYEGNLGQLGKQNSELKTLTAEELEAGKAVDILAGKYDGMAESVASAVGVQKQFENSFGDLKEAFGQFTKPFFDNLYSFLTKCVQAVTDTVNAILALMDKASAKAAWNRLEGTIAKAYSVDSYNDVSYMDSFSYFQDFARTWDNETINILYKYLTESMDMNSEFAKGAKAAIEFERAQRENDATINELAQKNQEAQAKILSEQQAAAEAEARAAEELAKAAAAEAQKWSDQWNNIMLKSINASDYDNAYEYIEAKSAYDKNYQAARLASPTDKNAEKVRQAMWNDMMEEWKKAHPVTEEPVEEATDNVSKSLFSLDEEINAIISPIKNAFMNIEAINALMNWQTTALNAFMDVIGPMINNLLEPLIGALAIIGNMLGQLFVPLFNSLAVILEPLYGILADLLNVMQPAFAITASLLGIIGLIVQACTPLLKVIEVITDAIGWVATQITKVVVLIAKGIDWLMNSIINIINAVIRAINNLPFVNIGTIAQSDLAGTIENSFGQQLTGAGLTAAGASTLSSLSNGGATYSGAKDIYININFDHSYVNGDAMEIALMLKAEMERAEAMGY